MARSHFKHQFYPVVSLSVVILLLYSFTKTKALALDNPSSATERQNSVNYLRAIRMRQNNFRVNPAMLNIDLTNDPNNKNDATAWDKKIVSIYQQIAKARALVTNATKNITVDESRSETFHQLDPNYFTPEDGGSNYIKPRPFVKRTNANSCQNIDNRSDILGAARNQDSVGWCFAFATADLLSHKLGVKISAIDAALSFFQTSAQKNSLSSLADNPSNRKNPYKSDRAGGQVQYVLAALYKQGGACKESDLPSNDYKESYAAFATKNAPDAANIENYYKSAQTKTLKEIIENIENIKRNSAAEFYNDEKALCEMYNNAQLIFPNLDLPTILGTIQGAKDSGDSIDWLQYLSCKDKRIKIPPALALKISDAKADIMIGHMLLPEIDAQLNKKNIVQATYKINMFLSSDAKKYNFGNSEHASSIVARRFYKGSCQYLMRNSWGPSCEYYDEAHKGENCENGNIWVSEEDLQKNLYEIIYFPQ